MRLCFMFHLYIHSFIHCVVVMPKGSKVYKISATPTLIVNGKKLDSGLTIDEYRKALDAALAKVSN